MKKCLLTAMLLVSMALIAQVDYVPFETVRHIAIENAKSLWGEVYADEPILLYSLDGNLIAYTFNFSIGQPFPARQTLIERCNSPAGSEEKTDRWLVGQFANMLVSASRNTTPILKYSDAISDDYAYGAKIKELAVQKLQTENCGLEKIIFMSDMAKWYVYADHAGNKAYVKVFPPVEVYNEHEFNEAVQQRYNLVDLWVIPADNENLWDSFLNGKLLDVKSTTLIPYEDYVPYYDWSYGCTPTAFSMALAYWDNLGIISTNDYGNLVKHHFQRFDHVQGDTDKNVPDLQKALAIAMSTDSMTGSTGSCCWLSGFIAETNARGYGFTGQDKYGTSAQYLSWAKTEIDAGRPYHMGTPGHSNTGVGYTSDNYLIRHDTWQPSHSSVYYTACDLVGTIIPGGQYGAAVNIISPFGDPRYSDNVVPPSQGEHLYAGDMFEITWNFDYYAGSYARLLYSTNGGNNWTLITSNTPNDGLFDWSIPSGLGNSSLGRVKIEARDGTTLALQAADGSWGNFDIHAGGSLPALSEDVSTVTTTVPDYYQFTSTSGYWSVVGLRATNGTDDWDIELHGSTSFNDVIAASTYGGNAVDFVVIDGNHTASTSRGIKARRYSGTSTARVEFEGGNDIVSVGAPLSTSWPANDVVEIYDVYLSPGKYGFILDVTSGTANLDFALYGSDGAAYYAPRSAYKAISNSAGAGGDEYFSYTITTADWYGLCIWANDANSANYTIRVEEAGTWTGLVNNNWHEPGNWSGNIVPDNTINVTIPSGTPYECWLYAANAQCNSMTIATGTYFRNYNKTITINGTLTINGQLMMDYSTPDAITLVMGNVIWNSGSTAWIASQTYIKVYGNWNFNDGATANIANGFVDFLGNTNSFIRCYSSNSSFYNLRIYKTDGASAIFSELSTNDLVINGLTFINSGASFRSNSNYNIVMRGHFNYYGTFDFTALSNNGSVMFDGTSQNINNYSSGSGTFKNVIFSSSTGTTVPNGDLTIAGNVTIDQGYFSPGAVTVAVKGNWVNNVGNSGFIPGTSTVIFQSGGNDQDVYGVNTFYNVTQVNTGKYLRFQANTTIQNNLVLNYYCWAYKTMNINGALYISNVTSRYTANGPAAISTIAKLIQGGTLLANGGGSIYVNDLEENYLWGTIEASTSSLIDIINSGTGTFIDLKGKLINNGGTINLSGSIAWWPYANGAELTISAGVIDLKTCGLYIPSSYTWTCNITGGTIKTSCGFTSNRADFAPLAGTFEFYGSSDFTINQLIGGSLYNVKINKGAKGDGDFIVDGPLFDERSGTLLSGGEKSNTITLGTNFNITGNLDITAGTFSLGSYTCHVSGTTNIYGTLAMTNAANDLTSETIKWLAGSNDNVTAGTFHAIQWHFIEGTNAKLGTGNTAYIYNLYYPTDDDAEFGNLVAVPSSKVLEGGGKDKAYYPVRVTGNFDMQGTSWVFNYGATDLVVSGNSNIPSGNNLYFSNGADFYTNGNLNLSGLLSLIGGGIATLHGELTFPANGYLNLDASSFVCDQNSASGSITLNGRIDMNAGSVFEISGRNVIIGATFNDDNILGGDLRFGRSLTATNANNFQLNYGNLEMMSSNSGHYMNIGNGNYVNNLFITKGAASIYIGDHLIIKGYFTLNSGIFNSNLKNMYVGRDWTNYAGPANFLEQTGTVFFNGSGDFNHQKIYGETFYNLTNAKTGNGHLVIEGPVTVTNTFLANGINLVSANLNVNGLLDLSTGELGLTAAAPTVMVNNFTMGGYLGVSGNFTCNDITNNGIFGTVQLYSGSITLNQVGNQYSDLNGSLTINGGTMTVNGTYDYCVWGYASPANLTMSNGVLNFNNPGIAILGSHTITTSISGGTIKTSGTFQVTHPNFTPTGGTAELYGSTPAGVQTTNGSHFYNLKIDKALATLLSSDGNSGSEQNSLPETKASQSDRIIVSLPADRSDNYASTIGNLKVNNNTVVEEGTLRILHDATNTGNVTINSGGILSMEGIGSLAMGNGKTLTVNSGGELSLQGNVTDNPKITSISGNYGLSIESGATISADYALLECMNTSGVNIKAGAIVNASKAFSNCIIRNGQSGGRLMTINNSQTFSIYNIQFPTNTWGGNYNVMKSVNSGIVTFRNYTGGFSGSTYESDINSRIHWQGQVAANVSLQDGVILAGQDECFEASNTLTIAGGGTTFVVWNGGSANLVAGQKVRLLDGTLVQSGGYMHAWIDPSGNYCNLVLPMVAVNENDLLPVPEIEVPGLVKPSFRVFPNPTTGTFTLELSGFKDQQMVEAEIFNMIGKRLFSAALPVASKFTFDLSSQQTGLYMIRVSVGSDVSVEKIIKQ